VAVGSKSPLYNKKLFIKHSKSRRIENYLFTKRPVTLHLLHPIVFLGYCNLLLVIAKLDSGFWEKLWRDGESRGRFLIPGCGYAQKIALKNNDLAEDRTRGLFGAYCDEHM